MDTLAVKMYFVSPLHIGRLGLGMEETDPMIHSDTLYAAIFYSLNKLFQQEKPVDLLISSAFPFVDNKLYLPRPCIELPGLEKESIRKRRGKAVKAARFISPRHFPQWINGEEVNYEEVREDQELLSANIKYSVRPRARLDRMTNDSVFYFVGQVNFKHHKAGLYFLASGSLKELEWLRASVRLLSDEGIGGERSSGYGRFIPEFIEKPNIPAADGGRRYVSLSLYCPAAPEEIEGALLSYQLIKRGGWTLAGKSYPQKRLIMLAEGSLFARRVEGKIHDISHPEANHKVYRNGRAYLVKVR